ncbi:MAG TPA: PAS domain S-box protein, partial [Candidatus Ozemobacteraceae bacterium]|nr:PAS domain S-box protein [Candidatus Ozemobacteraceae bacterium]
MGTIGADLIISSWLDWLHALKVSDDGYLFVLDAEGRPLMFPARAIQDLVGDPAQKRALLEAIKPIASQTWNPELCAALQQSLPQVATGELQLLFARMQRQETGVIQHSGTEQNIIAYAPVGAASWSVGICMPLIKTLSISETARRRMDEATSLYGKFFVGVLIFAAFVSGLIGFWSSRAISRPILGMIASIRELSRGGEWKPLVAETSDELRVLADSANVMVRTLRDNEKLLADIFNGVSDAIFLHDGETGKILRVNRKMCEMFKCTEEQALSASLDQLTAGIEPYNAAQAREHIKQALNGHLPPFQWRSRDYHGNVFWTEVSLTRAQTGDLVVILAVVRDISER